MKTIALPMVEDKDGQRVADALSDVLADTFVLYLFVGRRVAFDDCLGAEIFSDSTFGGWSSET